MYFCHGLEKKSIIKVACLLDRWEYDIDWQSTLFQVHYFKLPTYDLEKLLRFRVWISKLNLITILLRLPHLCINDIDQNQNQTQNQNPHTAFFSSSLPLTYDLEKLLRLMLMRCDSVTAAAATSMSVCLPVRPMNGPPPLSAATAAQC